jgi:hypothetical protein
VSGSGDLVFFVYEATHRGNPRHAGALQWL